MSLGAGGDFISLEQQLPSCLPAAKYAEAWHLLRTTWVCTWGSQRDIIYPAIFTSLVTVRHACTHRIIVGAGFRLLASLARVSKITVPKYLLMLMLMLLLLLLLLYRSVGRPWRPSQS